jgi:hypothetical protein
MLEHAPSICAEHMRSHCDEQMHVRNGRTYVRTTQLSSYVSLRIAREKSGKKSGGGEDKPFAGDLAALARRIEDNPEQFRVTDA